MPDSIAAIAGIGVETSKKFEADKKKGINPANAVISTPMPETDQEYDTIF